MQEVLDLQITSLAKMMVFVIQENIQSSSISSVSLLVLPSVGSYEVLQTLEKAVESDPAKMMQKATKSKM